MGSDDKTLAIITHILGWFTGFIGPLIVLLVTQSTNVKNHAKQALNWQFSLLIYFAVAFVLMFVFGW